MVCRYPEAGIALPLHLPSIKGGDPYIQGKAMLRTINMLLQLSLLRHWFTLQPSDFASLQSCLCFGLRD
jgi:hypothetical protein